MGSSPATLGAVSELAGSSERLAERVLPRAPAVLWGHMITGMADGALEAGSHRDPQEGGRGGTAARLVLLELRKVPWAPSAGSGAGGTGRDPLQAWAPCVELTSEQGTSHTLPKRGEWTLQPPQLQLRTTGHSSVLAGRTCGPAFIYLFT